MKRLLFPLLFTVIILAGCNTTVKYRPYESYKDKKFPSVSNPVVINDSKQSFDYSFDNIRIDKAFYLTYKSFGDVSVESEKKPEGSAGKRKIMNDLLKQLIAEGKSQGGEVIRIGYTSSHDTVRIVDPYTVKQRYQTNTGTWERTTKYNRHYVHSDIYNLSAMLYRRVRSDEEVKRILAIRSAVEKGRIQSVIKSITLEDVMSGVILIPEKDGGRVFAVLDQRSNLKAPVRFNLAQRLTVKNRLWEIYRTVKPEERSSLITDQKQLISVWNDKQILQYAGEVDRASGKTNAHNAFKNEAYKQKRFDLNKKLAENIKENQHDIVISRLRQSSSAEKSVAASAEKILLNNIGPKEYQEKNKKLFTALEEYRKRFGLPDNKSWDKTRGRLLFRAAGWNAETIQWLLEKGIPANIRVEFTWKERKPEYFSNFCRELPYKSSRRNSIHKEYESLRKNRGTYWTTPLHYAAMESRAEVVEILLKHGARPDDTDSAGIKACEIVEKPWSRHTAEKKLDIERKKALLKK